MVFAQYLCLTCCENPGQPNELRLAQPLEAVSVFWYHTAQFPLLKACDPGHLISPIIVFFHSRAGRTLLTYLSRAKSEHLAEIVAERICGDSKDDVDAQCFPVTAQQDWPPTPLHSATHRRAPSPNYNPQHALHGRWARMRWLRRPSCGLPRALRLGTSPALAGCLHVGESCSSPPRRRALGVAGRRPRPGFPSGFGAWRPRGDSRGRASCSKDPGSAWFRAAQERLSR